MRVVSDGERTRSRSLSLTAATRVLKRLPATLLGLAEITSAFGPGRRTVEPPLSCRLAGRMCAALFFLSGLVLLVNLLLPTGLANQAGIAAVGLIAVVAGGAVWYMPWERWPRSRLLWLVPLAFLLTGLFNHFNSADPYRYNLFFIVAFTGVGLVHPRGTALRIAPLLPVAYIIPLITSGQYSHAAATSLVYVVPVCVLIGETLAWFGDVLGRTQEALRYSDQRFRSLVQHSSDVINVVDAAGVIQYQSPSVERVLGYRAADLVGASAWELMHPDDVEGARESLAGVARSPGEGPPIEVRVRHSDGSWRDIELVHNNLLHDPSVRGIVVTYRDVTERKRNEALRASEEQFRLLFAHSPDAILLIDPHVPDEQWIIVDCNDVACVMNGYTREEIIGQPLTLISAASDEQATEAAYRSSLFQGETARRETLRRHKNGAIFPIESSASLIRLQDRALILGIDRDISHRKHVEQRLLHDASYDMLTDLPNRALFLERLRHTLARIERNPTAVFSVLFLDLDHFKVINDSLGHAAGDKMLIEAARRLITTVRPTDTVARFGGDEFAILLEEIGDTYNASCVAERIQRALALPFELEGQNGFTTASIGIALSVSAGQQPDELLRNADIAMYRAKALGKARHEIFDPLMYTQALARLRIEAELRQAIERNELVLYYQPILVPGTGSVSSVEALVRWQHPTRGLLGPNEFIPLAEETGLIIQIGEWVLATACAEAVAWQAAGRNGLSVSVNLSPRQFRQHEINTFIAGVLCDTGLAADMLTLELTETSVMDQPEAAIGTLGVLKTLGVRLALDDFGTGYSSMSYLKRLPLDVLKIDRSFIQGAGQTTDDGNIVAAIIALAHSLNLRVVAEGVETEAQHAFLLGQGCDAVQGFRYARPMPLAELRVFVEQQGAPI